MAGEDIQVLRDRILVLETTQGQIGPAAFRNVIAVVGLVCSLGGGLIGFYAQSILAPVESRVTVIENDITGLREADRVLQATMAVIDGEVSQNHNVMIERTEELTQGISNTLSTAAIEARFGALAGSIDSLQESIFRIVRERLQPQIDRNRNDAEDVENKFEDHLSNHSTGTP